MNGTTQSTIPNRCPSCGVPLDGPDADGMCPACLMSGVLRVDAETVPVDNEAATRSIGPTPPRQDRVHPSFELPYELGDYTLVATLGRGGMGTVYEAVQRSTGRRLALKLLAQNLDSPEMRQRFLREGRLAARVNHPASLYVFGSEEIDGIPVISMEIAAGGTLQDALDRRGPLPVGEAVDAVLSMVDGLEAALDRGVLHRDIKPSNCFVSPDGTVKVGDFGLSVSMTPSADSFMTQTAKVMGTPAFASPEQLRGDEVDVRSDIYAVGATLFTLLTARAPFEGDNAVHVVANVIDTLPADVSTVRDDLPKGLSRVITRCLAKEPAGRYADYSALRNALLPFSSIVPEPATQSQRGAAGWIDYLTAFLPTYAALMITVGPENLFIRPLYEFSVDAWRYHFMVFAAGFLYFTVTESLWGAGLGKWIMNLRVVRTDGRTPRPVRTLLRIIIPIATIEAVRIPLSVAALPSGDWAPIHTILNIGLATACPWIVAVLWLTARRSNGFATVWDLATGTRVVVRPRGARRPVMSVCSDINVPAQSVRCIGPFEATSDIKPGVWLAADDPVLRRQVWLIRRIGNLVSEARRAVARPGRARWLQELEADGQVWDAYEAGPGTPLSEQIAQGGVPWSTMRYWLHDLAAEIRAAERDGTLAPSYSLRHIWITDDGRAMLLDTPWLRAGEPEELMSVGSLAGQQRFLQAIVDHVDPLSVPLHARPALQNLRSGSFEKLTFLTGTLRGLLNKPADISRGLRGASLFVIPSYTWIATLLGIAGNTDLAVGPAIWMGRVAIAGLVMMHFMAFFDFILAFWRKSTGLSTFGLEAVTERGRASRTRMLARSAVMWLPVAVPTGVLGISALANDVWIDFNSAATLGAIALSVASIFAASALVNPARGLHDRIAGVWIGRR
ncbi:MAG: protein kinase [Phycisphaerales bacterium]|nr:protein kinase [Phycisphaerales bacterium]